MSEAVGQLQAEGRSLEPGLTSRPRPSAPQVPGPCPPAQHRAGCLLRQELGGCGANEEWLQAPPALHLSLGITVRAILSWLIRLEGD